MPLGLLYKPAHTLPGSSSLTRMVRQLQHFMGMAAMRHGYMVWQQATLQPQTVRLAVPCNSMSACTDQS